MKPGSFGGERVYPMGIRRFRKAVNTVGYFEALAFLLEEYIALSASSSN